MGDQLVSSQGVQVPIESISNLHEITTVYNLRVADHHTYFVGGALWGWDVWVHNAMYNNSADDVARVVRRMGVKIEQRDGKWVTVTTRNGREVVRSATGKYDFVAVQGELRALRPGDPVSTHTAPAGMGPIDYAGTITFYGRSKRGVLKSWDNDSGHFQPKSEFASDAGLPMNLFAPVPGT